MATMRQIDPGMSAGQVIGEWPSARMALTIIVAVIISRAPLGFSFSSYIRSPAYHTGALLSSHYVKSRISFADYVT